MLGLVALLTIAQADFEAPSSCHYRLDDPKLRRVPASRAHPELVAHPVLGALFRPLQAIEGLDDLLTGNPRPIDVPLPLPAGWSGRVRIQLLPTDRNDWCAHVERGSDGSITLSGVHTRAAIAVHRNGRPISRETIDGCGVAVSPGLLPRILILTRCDALGPDGYPFSVGPRPDLDALYQDPIAFSDYASDLRGWLGPHAKNDVVLALADASLYLYAHPKNLVVRSQLFRSLPNTSTFAALRRLYGLSPPAPSGKATLTIDATIGELYVEGRLVRRNADKKSAQLEIPVSDGGTLLWAGWEGHMGWGKMLEGATYLVSLPPGSRAQIARWGLDAETGLLCPELARSSAAPPAHFARLMRASAELVVGGKDRNHTINVATAAPLSTVVRVGDDGSVTLENVDECP